MKTNTLLKRGVSILLAVFLFCSLFSYAFWNDFFGRATKGINIQIGRHDDDYSDNPLENMPAFVPDHIVDILSDLAAVKDKEVVDALIDKVVNIFYNNPNSTVHLGATADDLFNPSRPPVGQGDLLIYTLSGGQIVFVYIDSNASHIPTNAQELETYLEHSWTGVNEVTILWRRGTLYNSWHAPIEYGGNRYMNINDGDRYVSPVESVGGTWFLLVPNLEYSDFNSVYPHGHITKVGEEYYIARTAVWNTRPSSSNAWAWDRVHEWNAGTTQAGTTVLTWAGGKLRFWRAVVSTASQPSETTARQGEWREVKNAWIGNRNDLSTKCYYFYHNRYTAGDIVVYGTSPTMQYRYFRAISSVPTDQPPLIEGQNGALTLNTLFWEEWT